MFRFYSGTWQRSIFGLLFSGTIALLAYRRHSLTRDGAVGAIITGTTTVGFGGWPWGLSLVFFFISSSLLSRFQERKKAAVAEDKFSKGSERDILQVAANGGIATACAFIYGVSRSSIIRRTCEAAYVGAFATATADTWATEIGTLSTQLPRLITTGKLTTPGTSGGITLLGTSVAASGAAALGLFFALLQRQRYIRLTLIGLVSGLAGSLCDSFLGATIQAMNYCPACKKETERDIHNCGTQTVPLRGVSWANNDVVNFLATAFGALVAIAVDTMMCMVGK